MDETLKQELESCREFMAEVGLDSMWEVGAARLIRLALSGAIEDPKLDAKVSSTLVSASAARLKAVGSNRIRTTRHGGVNASIN